MKEDDKDKMQSTAKKANPMNPINPTNFFEHLKNLLSQNEVFCKDGRLFRNNIMEAALQLKPELLQMLLNDRLAKEYFFKTISSKGKNTGQDIIVFDKVKFQRFISFKNFLPDSYSWYANKIGLMSDGAFIGSNKKVVLDFPYKDCVLEGGQTRDEKIKEKQQKQRQEIFYNEVIAPEKVAQLLTPKALGNFKRINHRGEVALTSLSDGGGKIKRDEKKAISENMLIKGNNLLTLHSLKKVYRGKIKLIYIDPPYNTGSDTFTYNDTFNHSTWLTFMKNRLEVARELLRYDGVIFISIDDNEQAYLKVLCDEIFGRENFVANLIWNNSTGGGIKKKYFNKTHENILCFSKNKIVLQEFNSEITQEAKKMYRKKDKNGLYRIQHLIWQNPSNNINQKFFIKTPDNQFIKPKKGYISRFIESTFLEKQKEGLIVFYKSKKSNFETANGNISEWNIGVKDYLTDSKKSSPLTILPKEFVGNNIEALNNLLNLGISKENFSYSKPYRLIQYLLKICTENSDLILDFFAGSGTTAHAVMELNKEDGGNRKFILIEQLDEHITICKERIQKVMQKQLAEAKEQSTSQADKQKGTLPLATSSPIDKTKISNKIPELEQNSFITCELIPYNQRIAEDIKATTDEKNLLQMFNKLKAHESIAHKVDFSKTSEDDFTKISIAEQKKILTEVLCKNVLYVPYSERENVDYKVSEADKKCSEDFYGEGKK